MNPPHELTVLGIWAAIIGITLTSLVTRLSFLIAGARARLSPRLEAMLRFAPGCALAAIVTPDLLSVSGQLQIDLHNHRLVAALCAVAIMATTRSLWWTIVVGMLVFTTLRLWA